MSAKLTQIRQNLLLVIFPALILVLVVLISVTFSIQRYIAQTKNQPNTLASASWEIEKVTTTGGSFVLELQSSIGNLRRYSGLKSYGLSNDGKTLAVSTDAGIELIDLATEKSTPITLAFAFSGDFGEALSWSHDNQEIAFIASKNLSSSEANLIVINTKGEVISQALSSFSYSVASGSKVFFPAKFSPTNKVILTRTFDNQNNRDELDPAQLKLFNIAGTIRKEIPLRDAVPKLDQITYTWSRDGERVLYSINPVGSVVDYAKEYSFNQTFIGF
jgi:hypothetical protein